MTANFVIEGDAVCHATDDVFVLVVGEEVPLARAVGYERLVRGQYAATPGGRICYRFREGSTAARLTAYYGLVFVNGRAAPERTDPRPFLMRRRD